MRKHWREIKEVLLLIIAWRFGLELVVLLGTHFVPLRTGFLGPNLWTNLDGVHYLSIAENGYFAYEQAFFPVYPLLIKLVTHLGWWSSGWSALIISHLGFVFGITGWYLLGKELKLVSRPKDIWPILLFPTSFFYVAGYNESLFLALSVWSMWLMLKNKWFLGSVLAGIASGTRLFGVFTLGFLLIKKMQERMKLTIPVWSWFIIPAGLIAYMIYLQQMYGDFLKFIHVQPAFGAGRSGGELIFLPQVIYRYIRIYITVPLLSLNYWVAVLEGLTFLYGIYLIWKNRTQKIFWPYLMYAGGILLLPTLSGTLSSIPRYFLSAFPLFWFVKSEEYRRDTITAVFFAMGLIILTILFTRGYFVA